MAETIIIIGAGIAGLSAGCYGQMNGYHTQIFELHNIPGGLCTAWERKGYVFDGCIHYLYGSGEGQSFNLMWQELGAVQGREMYHHEQAMRVVGMQGDVLHVYCNPDRLEQHLKDLSPDDAHLAEDLAEGVRQFKTFDMSVLKAKPQAIMGPEDWLAFGQKMMPFVVPLAKWGPLSAREFADHFKHPFLRQAVRYMFGWEDIPMMAGLMQLAFMDNRNAGFPLGASLEFARAVERRYLQLGGQICYKSQVERILVEDGRAVGVRLYDDSVHYADYVVSAADGRGTIFDMLGGEFVDQKIRQMYSGRLPTYPLMQVSLGVKRDLRSEPYWTTYLLEEPILITGEERHHLEMKHYAFDPSLAAPGKTSVVVNLPTSYGYWQRIYGRRLYATEQEQVADQVIGVLDRIYPGFRQDVEVIDVATPMSYERYTGNWQGSSCGWLLTKETMMMMVQGVGKTLPGLQHFFMAGQWVEPGGSLPTAAASGRNAIQMICCQDGREFKSSVA